MKKSAIPKQWHGETRNGRKIIYYRLDIGNGWYRLFKHKREWIKASAALGGGE